MADERELKDAKIRVRLETEEARKALDDLVDKTRPPSGPGEPSKPGETPDGPKPQVDDEREEEERERRRRRRRPRRRPGGDGTDSDADSDDRDTPGGIPGSRLAKGAVRAVQTVLAAEVAKMVTETVSGMIDERIESMDEGVVKDIVEPPMRALQASFDALSESVHALESAVSVLVTARAAALDVGVSQHVLIGQGSVEDVAHAVRIAAVVGGMERAIISQRRAIGRAALGGGIVSLMDDFKKSVMQGAFR